MKSCKPRLRGVANAVISRLWNVQGNTPLAPCKMKTRMRQRRTSYAPDTSTASLRTDNYSVGICSCASGRAMKMIRAASPVTPLTAVALVRVSCSHAVIFCEYDFHVSRSCLCPRKCFHHGCVVGPTYGLVSPRTYNEACLTDDVLAVLYEVYSQPCRYVCPNSTLFLSLQPAPSIAT